MRTRLRSAISPTVLSIELCDNAGVDTKTTLPVQNVCTEKNKGTLSVSNQVIQQNPTPARQLTRTTIQLPCWWSVSVSARLGVATKTSQLPKRTNLALNQKPTRMLATHRNSKWEYYRRKFWHERAILPEFLKDPTFSNRGYV